MPFKYHTNADDSCLSYQLTQQQCIQCHLQIWFQTAVWKMSLHIQALQATVEADI